MKRTIIPLAAFLLFFNVVNAQQTETELVRSAFRLEKKEEVAKFMQLNESDAKKFWPVYNEYETNRTALGDKRIKLIERYAAAYQKPDAGAAEKIWKESASIQRAEIALREKY